MIRAIALAAVCAVFAFAQDPTAVVEGQVTDPSGGAVSTASVEILNPANGYTQAGQFGSEGRNAVRVPGNGNVDLSALKTFQLGERMALQFRAECFNVANHANFAIPDNDIASPNFGRALAAATPRLLQFGLKLAF
jgi:hypothetical protein